MIRRCVRIAAAVVAATLAPGLAAQEYPSKTITIVASTGAGSASDMIGRLLAPHLQREWGRAVVVENRTGASGNIGVGSVVKAPPDGHTILVAPSTMMITPALVKDLGWEPSRDLQPVAHLAVVQLALVVHPSVAANNAAELIALAKARPGVLNYASPGSGTPQHLAMELFKQTTGTSLTHVPFKGLPQAVIDLIGGRVDAALLAVQAVLPHVRAGKLRMLATASPARTPWTPEVPTLDEQGIKGANIDAWIGTFLPAGAPPAVTARLGDAIRSLLSTQEVRDTLFKQGVMVYYRDAAELGRIVRGDLERYRRIAAEAGLRPE